MSTGQYKTVAVGDVPPDRRRGGELRVLLSPRNAGTTSGFMGVVSLAPGERIAEHYHPYSEEFIFLTRGSLTIDLDDVPVPLRAGESLYIPIGTRHRLRNTGEKDAFAVFQLSPLAPRPELGHVNTDPLEEEEGPPPAAQPPAPAPAPSAKEAAR
jgi:putative monooxygenase